MSWLRSDEEVGPLSPLAVSVAAGFSASVAAAASHGFDTARSRSQCTVLPKVCALLLVTKRVLKPCELWASCFDYSLMTCQSISINKKKGKRCVWYFST